MRNATNLLEIVTLGFIVVLCLLGADASAVEPSVEDRFTELHRIERTTSSLPERDQARVIARSYQSRFADMASGESLRRASGPDLGFILRAAEIAAIYTSSVEYLEAMREVLAVLERRGVATDHQRIAVYRALIGDRDFEAAHALLRAHPQLQAEPVPTVSGAASSEAGATMMYRVGSDPLQLQRAWRDVSRGIHLIIVTHPLCGFSQRAMTALRTDPELAPILRRHALWLAPVDRWLHLDAVRRWNRAHPETQVVIANRRSDWPMIDAWATPQFYLVSEGRLIGKVSGWPETGHRDALRGLLSAGGLLDDRMHVEAGVTATVPGSIVRTGKQ